jgi:hypothetical protein
MDASIRSESEDVMATAARVEMTWIEGFSLDRLYSLARDHVAVYCSSPLHQLGFSKVVSFLAT